MMTLNTAAIAEIMRAVKANPVAQGNSVALAVVDMTILRMADALAAKYEDYAAADTFARSCGV